VGGVSQDTNSFSLPTHLPRPVPWSDFGSARFTCTAQLWGASRSRLATFVRINQHCKSADVAVSLADLISISGHALLSVDNLDKCSRIFMTRTPVFCLQLFHTLNSAAAGHPSKVTQANINRAEAVIKGRETCVEPRRTRMLSRRHRGTLLTRYRNADAGSWTRSTEFFSPLPRVAKSALRRCRLLRLIARSNLEGRTHSSYHLSKALVFGESLDVGLDLEVGQPGFPNASDTRLQSATVLTLDR
jgi:hypothetical protein